MTRLLVPDSGPLFSLAAGDLLDLLTYFRLAITDVVKEETIDKGQAANASAEARKLLSFYIANKKNIEVIPTQVGHSLRAMKVTNPKRQLPPNIGELSIQSFLIDLQLAGETQNPVILFEDSWFLRNQKSLAKPCFLLSTEAFLINAEKLKLIKSASKARAAISTSRPTAYTGIDSLKL
jgi:hypothetical protein